MAYIYYRYFWHLALAIKAQPLEIKRKIASLVLIMKWAKVDDGTK